MERLVGVPIYEVFIGAFSGYLFVLYTREHDIKIKGWQPDVRSIVQNDNDRKTYVTWATKRFPLFGLPVITDKIDLRPLILPDQPRPDGSPVLAGTRLRQSHRERNRHRRLLRHRYNLTLPRQAGE